MANYGVPQWIIVAAKFSFMPARAYALELSSITVASFSWYRKGNEQTSITM
jgi:hypothetical protein